MKKAERTARDAALGKFVREFLKRACNDRHDLTDTIEGIIFDDYTPRTRIRLSRNNGGAVTITDVGA